MFCYFLNTLEPLGKFDGKAKEGFLVGYSVNSKAFRVFNSQTRKVEENLHVNFLENKPNVAGQGPNWLFDIDSLTNSMNYQPVTAGNQSNKNAGPKETNGNTGLKKNIDAGKSEEKNVSTQQYIVFPLWSSISSNNKSLDETDEDDTADHAAGEKLVQKPASENQQTLKNVLDKMMDQEKEAKDQSDSDRKEFEAQCNRKNLSGKTTKANSTNSFNTVSTSRYMPLVHKITSNDDRVVICSSSDRKEFDAQCNRKNLSGKTTRANSTNSFNTVSTLVNAAGAPRTSNDAGPSFVPLGGSFPDDPLMPDLEDTAEVQNTGIFGSAYDDDEIQDQQYKQGA
ncbi:hypothetical protein Tco_0578436 [Tanacetum coccineum]